MNHCQYFGGARRIRLRAGLGVLVGFRLLVTCAMAQAAGIVPDGATATTVSINGAGRSIVNLAPAQGNVSHNTYSSFNVGSAGATLDNTGINARTIVNQVTSTNPSAICGEITVAGPRANVVLANPNGITLNGGSFTNTGRVALTTGKVSFSDTLIGGVLQRNVVLDTSSGTIVVGPQGLTSTLIGLDLIAKNLIIAGQLNNPYSSPTAYARAVAGSSEVTLNTGVSPGDNANDWLKLQANAAPVTANSFAVDITAAGSVTSGRVELIVTDSGPGVRSAGALNASLGDFTLSSNGSVQISNSKISAAQSAMIQAQGMLALTDTQITAAGPATLMATLPLNFTGSSLIAGGSVLLSGAGITLQTDSAGTGSTVASANSGVILSSSGDITNLGSLVQGQTRIAGNPASLGAVTLNASGNVLNQSLPNTGLGVLYGVGDDVAVTAGGSVSNRNARIRSAQSIVISAGGDVDNLVDHTTGGNHGAMSSYSRRGSRFLLFSHRSNGFSVDYGAVVDPTKLAYIAADSGNVTIQGNTVSNVGGSILSNGGSIAITAKQALLTQAVFSGQASYDQACFIFCHASAASTVQAFGGVIEANNDIALAAGTQITNTGGSVLALGGLTLNAPTTLAQSVLGYSTVNRGNDLKAWFGNTWAAIYASDTGGIYAAGSGQVQLTGEGDIDGGGFNAPGGVHAANGIVTFRAPHPQPVLIGNHVGLVSWFGL